MQYTNFKAFFFGIAICSIGAFITTEMLNSTSWTTYSSTDRTGISGDGEVISSRNYTTEKEIGLRETTFVERGEICDENDVCSDYEMSWKYSLLEINCEEGNCSLIDCTDADDVNDEYISRWEEEVREVCATESAGSTGHSIIFGGLGLLGLTFIVACIGVWGYIPGWVLKLLSSSAAIALFVGPIVWFVMLPDLNSGWENTNEKWGLSHAFYLTLFSSPVVLVGGFVMGRMEAFSLEAKDDLGDEEYDYCQTDE